MLLAEHEENINSVTFYSAYNVSLLPTESFDFINIIMFSGFSAI